MEDMMLEHDWFGLYADSWTGEIVPDAFSHPAKFSRGLIRKIYQHLLEQGYIRPGDRILDTFGGVALGALDAMRYGLDWYGVELEARFCALGQQNIAEWNRRYAGWFETWGTAQIIQGDSRRLVELVGQAAGVVSSPPYAASFDGRQVDSKPREQREREAGKKLGGGQINHPRVYGSTPGQLGAMREGDIDGVLSSPPYAATVDGTGEGPGARHDYKYHSADNARKQSSEPGYGTTPGNLGGMVEGVNAVVSSPPFEESIESGRAKTPMVFKGDPKTGHYREGQTIQGGGIYGDHPANIGNDSGDTFWTAARVILEQTYAVLKPGGVAAFVTGDFVRQSQRVEFGRQWLQLCESVGFIPAEWIRAWKVEPRGEQLDIFGNGHSRDIERVSFFRRLANQRNPDAAILNEDVLILLKGGDRLAPVQTGPHP